MALSSKLADLFVKFTVEGIEAFQAGIKQVQTGLKSIQTGTADIAKAAEAAFGKARLALMGFVTAGIAMSVQGQVLAFHMERLSRSISGLFGPEIRQVIQFVATLTDRLAAMSNAQRAQLARWIEAGVAALTFATILPRVIGGINLMIGAVRALTAALVSSGWGAILVAVGAIASAFLALGLAGEVAQGGLGALWSAVKPLFDAFAKVAGTLMKALEPLLVIATEVFEGIAGAVLGAMPAVLQAVGTLAGAFRMVLQAVGPVAPMLASFFQDMVQAGAAFLPMLAEMVVVLVKDFAPILREVAALGMMFLKSFGPMIPIFMGMAAVILKVLVPALKVMTDMLMPLVWLMDKLTGASKFKMPDFKMQGLAEEGNRGMATPRLGGFEDIGATWKRIAEASRLVGTGRQSPEAEANEWRRKIEENTRKTKEAAEKAKGPIK